MTMISERCVERVVVVANRVRRIELVAVLAVDDPVYLRLEGGAVRQGELLDETCALELGADLPVPPSLLQSAAVRGGRQALSVTPLRRSDRGVEVPLGRLGQRSIQIFEEVDRPGALTVRRD
jgi:hypothetical protein